MNLTELMQQHMVKTQETDQICQLIENIIYVDSEHNKVFDYILQHGLATKIDTVYHSVKYVIDIQSTPLERQVYPQKPKHMTLDIYEKCSSTTSESKICVRIGYDQYSSFFIDVKYADIEIDVLEHCLNALFD